MILICLSSHLVDGHLDCFLVLATMNNVTKNMGIQTSVHVLTFTFFIHVALIPTTQRGQEGG